MISTKKVHTVEDVRTWIVEAARAADDKQGSDTIILEVGPILAITEAFVITSGSNPRQVRTIADEVEDRVKAIGGPAPLRIEGLDDARWVLIDYGDFVVHVFNAEVREYYELERLWGDAARMEWQVGSSTGH
ncbi:MAG: ribosome silencing factor [Acidimicrobiales bacterium]